MLGVCLLFVGIVLINNGMCTLYNVDGKSTAVMNIFTGGLSLFINFVNLVQGNYYAAGTGLLFCFTYLFVAFSRIFAGRESGISGQSSGELPLWKTSWAKNWENLFRCSR